MTPSTAQWLAYAVLLLQAIIFVFFLLMLITKAVEGFIRLFGGVHFDESTHPLDGGLFGAIADLDCLNPKGGKAAERKRRKRGSKQLQRNVSAAGSLTTQMMLDRHSLGIMRPVSEGAGGGHNTLMTPTPFLSPPSSATAGPGERSYFPAYTPPLGPPPMERHSSDSRSDEPHMGGNIMDAWGSTHANPHSPPLLQPGYLAYHQSAAPGPGPASAQAHARSQSTPNPFSTPMGTPQAFSPQYPQANANAQQASGGFSVIRGGRADYNSPYAVRTGTGSDRSLTMSPPPSVRVSPISPKPTHSRQHSSSAVIETYDNNGNNSRISPPIYPPQPQPQPHPHPQGRRQSSGLVPPPPIMAPIPKRRSLNNLREDSPTRQHEEEEAERKRLRQKQKQKQQRRKSWFRSDEPDSAAGAGAGGEDDTEESDDEPGPSRRQRQPRRKSKLVPLKEPAPFEPIPMSNLHGAGAGAGHAHPGGRSGGILGFLGLRRKTSLDDMAVQAQDENKARKAALAAESGAMLVGVQPAPADQRSFKVARRVPGAGAGASARASPSPAPAPAPAADTPSFKVKRSGAGAASGSSTPRPTPAPVEPETEQQPSRSFKVVRPNMPHASNSGTSSAASSFVVNRPTPPPVPAAPAPSTPPLSRAGTNVSPRTPGKASMFQSSPRPL